MAKYVVMGVSGCGKSAIGAGFAVAVGAEFVDGDDLHPAANVAKMASGKPLNDEDRAPWLAQVGRTLGAQCGACVIACSALKRSYRNIIRKAAGGPVTFLHLQGDQNLIGARMRARQGHFMPTELLDSQFAALEVPGPDEDAVTVDIDRTPKAIITALMTELERKKR